MRVGLTEQMGFAHIVGLYDVLPFSNYSDHNYLCFLSTDWFAIIPYNLKGLAWM